MIKKWIIIGIILISTSAPTLADSTERSTISGNVLYVGGSGPGNYTTIQKAINASIDGDTVFVFQASSPYNESLIIKKSIKLIGQNHTIIMSENGTLNTIFIDHDSVIVHNFKFDYYSCSVPVILVENSKFVNISHCVFHNQNYGLYFVNVSNSSIFSNLIESVGWYDGRTISLKESKGIMISNNMIDHYASFIGIDIMNNSDENLLFNNHLDYSVAPHVFATGLRIFSGEKNRIIHNNFVCHVYSNVHAYFSQNYWYPQYDLRHYLLPFPKIIISRPYSLTTINFDWHPAHKLYNITWS